MSEFLFYFGIAILLGILFVMLINVMLHVRMKTQGVIIIGMSGFTMMVYLLVTKGFNIVFPSLFHWIILGGAAVIMTGGLIISFLGFIRGE